MQKLLRPGALLVAITTVCIAFAQPPPGYYDAAAGLSGPALKAALNDIISPHTVHTNAQLWNDFMSTDKRADDPNKVWDIYSDIPGGSAPYLFSFGTDQCGTYNGEGDCYNREHSVPQSWFNSNTPMVTDLHHIYPTDGWVNARRGDLPYGLVGAVDFQSQNGTKVGSSITPGYGGTVCEPIDAFKGDLARTYFYMMTRYMPLVGSWTSDAFSSGDLSPWAENLLLSWSAADPVSQKEIDRNNAVYAIQNNRNPFIDHPEWAYYIWGPTASVHEPTATAPQIWVNEGVLHRNASITQLSVQLFSADGQLIGTVSMTGDRAELPALAPGVYVARVGDRSVRFVP